MTRFMLDTNICVELIRGRAPGVFARFKRHRAEAIGISIITLAELQFGAAKSAEPERNMLLLAKFCAPLAILPFDNLAAATYGTVRAGVEGRGASIGPLNTLIASHALSLANTLVTNNRREFDRVEGLRVENWLAD